MLLIYSSEITPRLNYIFRLIFKEILGAEFRFTTETEEFIASGEPKISYSDKPVGDELFFYAHGLLSEKGISDQRISVFDWKDGKVFFGTHPKYIFPFDPFAASFYLVSRYEEYLPHIRDAHDRYIPAESLAFQKGFIGKPVVNTWAEQIKKVIAERYPGLEFKQRKYRFISTIDVDNAWAYLEKGFMRTAGSYLKSLVNLDFEQFFERTRVLLGMQRDPYDTYNYMLDLHLKHKLRAIYFFLMGEYSENDKNVSPDSRKFQSLIKSLADYSEVGIHPSYAAAGNPARVRKEISLLSKILRREVTRSRQHFLKLKFPLTYRMLIDLDITNDYTMGYAHHTGFRAGICTPFYFYDLDLEQATTLRIHSFAVMDATLKYYMKIKPEDALHHIKSLVDVVKSVNGDFVSLWHNESLSNHRVWKGWKPIYEQMIEYALP